jgi:hypothetical protein
VTVNLTVCSEGRDSDAAAAGCSHLSRPAVTVTSHRVPGTVTPPGPATSYYSRVCQCQVQVRATVELSRPPGRRGTQPGSRFTESSQSVHSMRTAGESDRPSHSASHCQAWPSVTDGVGRSVESPRPLAPRPGAHFSGIVAAIKFAGPGPPSQSSARSVSARRGRSRFGVVPGAGQGPHRRAHGPPGLA